MTTDYRTLALECAYEAGFEVEEVGEYSGLFAKLVRLAIERDRQTRGEPVALIERTAQIAAHRACCGTEHDPANGKLHGYCVVCGVPWPCAYAGTPQPEPEGWQLVPKELFDHWRGLCCGTDWNNGTHAKAHRAKIVKGMAEMLAAAPKKGEQP